MHSILRSIQYHLPERCVSSADLAAEFPEWPVKKIEGKTGIQARHIAAPDETAGDLAAIAARKLFETGVVTPGEIDFVLLCTQSPDHPLPTTACLLQHRLGIPTSAGALDFNLGCSGFVYGLGLAEGLIATGQAKNVLLLTAETYSKFIHKGDRSVRTVFGDAAAATLISARERQTPWIGPFAYGTDGSGGENLIVPAGGARLPHSADTAAETTDDQGNIRSKDCLFMEGREVFGFTLSAVPESVQAILDRAGQTLDTVDLFIFHQANAYMLEHLRAHLQIPREKFVLAFGHCGNTVSSTIPIALWHAAKEGALRPGMRVMLVGFGVGYSWGGTLVEMTAEFSV